MILGLNDYEEELLTGWEEVYKRGQLTLWILLALHDGSKHMAAVKEYIATESYNRLSADDQSMYRALRRYFETDIVTFENQKMPHAPDRKVYSLTVTGGRLLEAFITRNIMPLLQVSIIKQLGDKYES